MVCFLLENAWRVFLLWCFFEAAVEDVRGDRSFQRKSEEKRTKCDKNPPPRDRKLTNGKVNNTGVFHDS